MCLLSFSKNKGNNHIIHVVKSLDNTWFENSRKHFRVLSMNPGNKNDKMDNDDQAINNQQSLTIQGMC